MSSRSLLSVRLRSSASVSADAVGSLLVCSDGGPCRSWLSRCSRSQEHRLTQRFPPHRTHRNSCYRYVTCRCTHLPLSYHTTSFIPNQSPAVYVSTSNCWPTLCRVKPLGMAVDSLPQQLSGPLLHRSRPTMSQSTGVRFDKPSLYHILSCFSITPACRCSGLVSPTTTIIRAGIANQEALKMMRCPRIWILILALALSSCGRVPSGDTTPFATAEAPTR